jgi:hypothetical protein
LLKPTILYVPLAAALVMLGVSIGEAAAPRPGKTQPPKHHAAMVMGFYSPSMCQQDGGKADGPVSFCTLKDGYVIKFGDFADYDCETDNGRTLNTAWGKFCALPSGYSVKIDMSTSHAL